MYTYLIGFIKCSIAVTTLDVVGNVVIEVSTKVGRQLEDQDSL